MFPRRNRCAPCKSCNKGLNHSINTLVKITMKTMQKDNLYPPEGLSGCANKFNLFSNAGFLVSSSSTLPAVDSAR